MKEIALTRGMKAKKKSCSGVTVKLSEVNKYIDEEGNVHILHCVCIKKNLWSETYYTETYDFPVPDQCSECDLWPWEMHAKVYGHFTLIRRNK